MNIRRCALLFAGLCGGAAGSGPLQTTLVGAVKANQIISPRMGLPSVSCVINGVLNAGATGFTLQGPATALYRRDTTTGAVTLTLPPIIYGHTTATTGGQTTAVLYAATGTAQLTFNTATAGSVIFLPGGVTQPNPKILPSFFNYKYLWNPALSRLALNFDLHMGNCFVPLFAAFQE